MKRRKWTAMLLTVCMLLSLLPGAAFAEGETLTDEITQEETQVCETCGEDPCVCEKDQEETQVCEACGEDPCVCEKDEGETQVCEVCGKDPCECEEEPEEELCEHEWNDGEAVEGGTKYTCALCGESHVLAEEDNSFEIQTLEETEPQADGIDWTANEITIITVEELQEFAAQVNSGNTFAGKTVKLGVNIDLTAVEWTPIGSNSRPFKGTFDGSEHTISNLNVTGSSYVGLFGYIGGNAEASDLPEIKNLTVENVTVSATGDNVGGVVGNAFVAKVTNVRVMGTVDIEGRGYVGGIVGHGYVKVDNCSVEAGGTIKSNFWCVGGIVGYGGEGFTTVTDTAVDGGTDGLTITSAAGAVAGIIGRAEDNNGTQPCSGSGLSVKNVNISTFTGVYGDGYADNGLAYFFGGDVSTEKLTGALEAGNVTVETSTGATPTISDVVASVDGKLYASLQDAIDAAGNGDTVTLLADTSENSILEVKKSITINGDNHKVTSTANRILWVDESNVTVTLNDIEFISDIAQRGVQVNQNLTGVTLDINDCVIPGTYYAVNICSGTSVTLNIDNSEITGWGALNLWGDTYDVTVTNSHLTGINDKSYDADGWNDFGVIVLEGDTTYQTEEHVNGCHLVIDNCTIESRSTTGNTQEAILFNAQSQNNVVEIKGNTQIICAGEALTPLCVVYGSENQLNISDATFTGTTFGFVNTGNQMTISGGDFPAMDADTLLAAETSGIAISGGTFGSDVFEYCVDDKTTVPTDGKFTIGERTPSVLTTDIGEKSFKVGEAVEFTFTTTANSDAGRMVIGTSNFSNAEAIEKLEYYEVRNDQWYELNGDFGTAEGFPMADATSTFRVTFKTAGAYTFTASMKLAGSDKVLCSTEVSFGVSDAAGTYEAAIVGGGTYTTLKEAIAAAQAGDTVTLLKDVTLDTTMDNAAYTSAIMIKKDLTLDGGNNTITVSGNLHGIQVYGNVNVTVKNVTITGAGKDALLVNGGANVTANGLKTSGNAWGAVNVNKASTFTFDETCSFAEDNKVWVDGEGSTVNKPGSWNSYTDSNGQTFYTNAALTMTLNQTRATLYTNTTPNTVNLTATVTGILEGKTPVVTWTTSNDAVATVADGVVTAVGNGTATITATVGDLTATCTVTVSRYTSGGGGGGGSYRPSRPSQPEEDLGENDVPLAQPLPFIDVTENDWFYAAVRFVFDKDMIKGTNEAGTLFEPLTTTTRGMIVTILHRLEEEPEADAASFSDVAAGAWYTDAVNWAAASGVVKGMEDGAFHPEDVITREQMAAILSRYATLKGYDKSAKGSLDQFQDRALVSDWAEEDMIWALGAGILKGRGDGVLDPTGTTTRSEAAEMLKNFCEKFEASDEK